MKTPDYQIPVLMYHRVVEARNDAGKHNIYVYRKNLIRQFEYLKKQGYQTITFKDLQDPGDDSKKIILTFDDGYVDNYNLLFPLLQKYQFTAVIFLVTQQTRNEWGIAEGEPAINLMTAAQMKEMHEYGVEFGGHTRTHVDMTKLTHEKLRDEIAGCKQDVENILNSEVISFSYPFGAFNEQVKKVVKESGFRYGIATKTGPDKLFDDLFQIKRIEVSYRTSLSRFKTKVSGNYFKPSLLQRIFNKK
jgi:peptidoglycan/xylan/chitin deacetylase (PgdA/CDA1 family)